MTLHQHMIKRRNDHRILFNEAKGERVTAQAIKAAVQNKTWKDMDDIRVQAPSRYEEAMGPLPSDISPQDNCHFLKEMYRQVKSFSDPAFAHAPPKKSVKQTKSTSKGTKSQKKSSKSKQPNKKKDVAKKGNKKKDAASKTSGRKKSAAVKAKKNDERDDILAQAKALASKQYIDNKKKKKKKRDGVNTNNALNDLEEERAALATSHVGKDSLNLQFLEEAIERFKDQHGHSQLDAASTPVQKVVLSTILMVLHFFACPIFHPTLHLFTLS